MSEPRKQFEVDHLTSVAARGASFFRRRVPLESIQIRRGSDHDFNEARIDVIADVVGRSAEIVARLVQMEHRPWPEWRRGRPITPVQVASILNLYGIRPETHRFGSETAKGYLLLQFSDAFNRYVEA